MTQLSRDHWPPNERYSYCRVPIDDSGCGLKQGSPFGPFWDEIGVDFISSVYTGLSYDVHIPGVANDWLTKLVTTVSSLYKLQCTGFQPVSTQ